MHRTRNIRVLNAHSSRSATALPCHFTGCDRVFTTFSGRTQHMRRVHYSPQSETPQADASHIHPQQQVSPISSPQIALNPELRSSSPIADSRPSTPASFNPDVEMGSSPRSCSVEIEDITGQEDEYDDVYVPEDPRLSPGARPEGNPVPESPHQSQRAASSGHEAHPSPTIRIYHSDLNGM
jgi:hypothetical protein